MSKPHLTAARLRELLHYDWRTGLFTWLQDQKNGQIRAGSVAGTPSGGYILIGIEGRRYRAHRLAWFYMKGKWPSEQIDHRNTVRNDNRWRNLREATREVNTQNLRRAKSTNRLGVLGVREYRGRFNAGITVNRKRKHLGTYDTPEMAHAAYLKAKRELHEGCTL